MGQPEAPDPDPRFGAARAALATAFSAGTDGSATELTSEALTALVDDVLTAGDDAVRLRATWLLLTVLTGALPSPHDLDDAVVALRTHGPAELVGRVVGAAPPASRVLPSRCLGGTWVDVTTTARTSNQAGVPRVVRRLVAEWGEPDGVTLVVWDALGFRTLDADERAQLGLPAAAAVAPGTRVVPLGATFSAVEVLRPEEHANAVEAMALAGVADVRGIVYDLASLVETHPDAARGPFLHHLSALAQGSRVSAISHAVAADVTDYFSVLRRNGRAAPDVSGHPLPDDAEWDGEPSPEARASLESQLRGDSTWPLVAVVSSLHRRKNHARLLAACEELWEQGVAFRLLVVEGTGSRIPALQRAFDRLVERGRPLTVLSHVSDAELQAAYRLARVSAYASLAEGYGLPIVESLAAGTPVVTSRFGSMAELADGGGVLEVDPRDVGAIAAALRSALEGDPDFEPVAKGAEARTPARSWQEYARTVGAFLGIHDNDVGTERRAP